VGNDTIVRMLKALADPTRLRIYLFLRAAHHGVTMDDHGDIRCDCGCGKTVGEVSSSVLGEDKIPSSLSFHLKELKNAGVIQMEKKGKYVFCFLNIDAERQLKAFFDGQVSEEKNDERKMRMLRQL